MKPDPTQANLFAVEATSATKPPLTSAAIGMPAEEYRRRVSRLPKLKALSIRQPWAWLIIRPDLVGEARNQARLKSQIKDFENREWQPANPGRKFRGPFLVHAAKGCTRAEYLEACQFARRIGVTTVPPLEQLPRGGIVGQVEVGFFYDSTEELDEDSPWQVGSGFTLRLAEPLPFVPCAGVLGFFNPVFPEVK